MLFTVDKNTSTVNEIGALPTFLFGGISFHNSGDIYAFTTATTAPANTRLYLVDKTNANTTLIGTVSSIDMDSFAIMVDVGYAIDIVNDDFYQIDLSNAV